LEVWEVSEVRNQLIVNSEEGGAFPGAQASLPAMSTVGAKKGLTTDFTEKTDFTDKRFMVLNIGKRESINEQHGRHG
jgi:hypothetical protein